MKTTPLNKTIRPLAFILLLSIVLMVVLFFVQSRSDKSIRAMQQGNELAVKTFQINNILQEIINNTYFLESQARKEINTGNHTLTTVIKDTIVNLQKQLAAIEKLTETTSAGKSVADLNALIQKKITVTREVLDSNTPRELAKKKLTDPQNKELIDNIYIAASDIQIASETALQNTILENSTVSNQVLLISRALTIFALITIVLSATLIIRHLVRNNQLIRALDQARIKADMAGSIKEQFLANMSHEIRTPLNSIIGFSNLASKTVLTGEQKDYINFIKSSGENLLYIINDILDFSKLEAGKLQISKLPFELNEICRFIEMLFQVQLTEKKIHFSWQIAENIPLHLTGDDDRLKQILTNLVSNAIKFTGPGGRISLRLSLVTKTDDTVMIRFGVKDSGIGIPEDKLKTVFERFEQADSATTRKYGGTGLGLSIVKHLVSLQNGSVDVNSKINEGSEFIVNIPYTINLLGTEEKHSTETMAVEKKYRTDARILIAEDNKMNQLFLKYLFQNWKTSFTLATDGKEAIELIGANEYDIILLDIQMPQVDGFGVAKWIRANKSAKVPVIALTAHTLPSEIEKTIEAGMNDYLPKPIKEENLIAVLNRYIPKTDMQLTEITKAPAEDSPFLYVDLNSMQKMFGNDSAMITDLLGLFAIQFPDELGKLYSAFTEKNMQQVFLIAHNLKTTVSSLKTDTRLLAPLVTIESYKNTEADWSVIEEKIAELNHLKETVLQEIQTIQKNLVA